MRKPVNLENRQERNDLLNYYNPNKLPTPRNNYAQDNQTAFAAPSNTTQSLASINPVHPEGLVPPPKDSQYETPF